MTKIIFVDQSGTRYIVEAEDGRSIMQAARDQLVPGIIGECGGCCSCATCHAYVDPQYLNRLPPASPDERDILAGAVHARENSRLTCQLRVSEALEGLTLHVPESQT